MFSTIGPVYLTGQIAKVMAVLGPYHPDIRPAVKKAVGEATARELAGELNGIAYVLDVDYGDGVSPDVRRFESLAAMYAVQTIAQRFREDGIGEPRPTSRVSERSMS
jgi:hypothetical protein